MYRIKTIILIFKKYNQIINIMNSSVLVASVKTELTTQLKRFTYVIAALWGLKMEQE